MMTFADWIDIGILLREKHPDITCDWRVLVVEPGRPIIQTPILPPMPETVPMYDPEAQFAEMQVTETQLDQIRMRSGTNITLGYEPISRTLIFWDLDDLHDDRDSGPKMAQVPPLYVLLAWDHDNPRHGWNAFRQALESPHDPDIRDYLNSYDVVEVIDMVQCKRILLWRDGHFRRP